MPEETTAGFLQSWLEHQSVPTVLLVVVLVALWKVARFLAPKISTLIDAHLRFLNRTAGAVEDLGTKIDANSVTVAGNSEAVNDLVREVRDMARKVYGQPPGGV